MEKKIKDRIIGGLLFVLIIFLFLGLFVYAIGNENGEFKVTEVFSKLSGKDNNNKENEVKKISEEISYMGSGIVDIANSMNNLKLNQIDVKTEVAKEGKDEQQDSQKSSKGKQSGKEESSEGESKQSSEGENINMEVELNKINESEDIKWDEIESKIQTLNQAWPVIIIDLKQKEIDNEIILNATERKDDLLQAIYKKDKTKVIQNCYLIYEQYVKIYEKIEKEGLIQKEKILYETLKMYNAIENKDITNLKVSINNANEILTQLITKVEKNELNEISVKKTYVIINNFSLKVNKMKEEEIEENKKFLLSKYLEIMEETLNI